MTDEQAIELYTRMKEFYGDKLPDPEHHPVQFKYYAMLFRKYHLA